MLRAWWPAVLLTVVVSAPKILMAQEATDSTRVQPDEPPELTNAQALVQSLSTYYPDSLKKRGVRGRAEVLVRVDSSGKVTRTKLQESSGHSALDSAALQVAKFMVFEPATKDGEPVASWFSQDLAFQPPGSERLVELNRKVPSARVRTLDGRPVELASVLGPGTTFLHFIATWCVGCRDELPALETVAEADRPRGVKVVSIALKSSDLETLREWRDAQKIDHPILIGLDQAWLRDAFGAPGGVPYSVVVRNGTAVGQVIGGVDASTIRRTVADVRSDLQP